MTKKELVTYKRLGKVHAKLLKDLARATKNVRTIEYWIDSIEKRIEYLEGK